MAKGVSEVTFLNDELIWKMGVKKDSMDEREYTIDVLVDCKETTKEQFALVCGGGQSTRVKIQSLLRKKTRDELASIEVTGFMVTWKEVYTAQGRTTKDYVDVLMTLTKDEFVTKITRDLGVSDEQAIEIYNRKHGIEN